MKHLLTFIVLFISLTPSILQAEWSTDQRSIAEQIAAIVNSSYAVPETAARMRARVLDRAASGAYDGLSPAQLAEGLNDDLQSVAHDQHMMLMYSAQELDADFGKKGSIIDPSADPAQAQSENHGISRTERLIGNIGYFKLDRFYPPQLAAQKIATAMQSLSGSDALIVDVRDNVGGHPRTVAIVASYFFAGRTHLNNIVDRQNARTTEFWTDPPTTSSFVDKPIFVLISGNSYSAAEELAYDLQVLKRAVLIGKRTAGAANPAIPIRINDHLVLYLPTGRAVNPATKTNWEGSGVQPDIEIAPAKALALAHTAALELLLKTSTGERAAELKRALAAVQKDLKRP
jgi:hypothetical protein